MPVGAGGDGAVPVGAPGHEATTREPAQHGRGGMAVAIPRPDAQDHLGRTGLVEPTLPGGAPGSVMPRLEQGDRPDPAAEPLLHRQARVAGEQGAEAAVADEQDDRVLVQVEPGAGPAGRWMEDAQDHAIELELLPGARRQPAAPILTGDDQEVEVGPIGDQGGRLDHDRWPERADHRLRAAEVIEVRVTQHEQGQAPRPAPPEGGRHHPAPGITPPIARPRVDQDPAPGGSAKGDGIALAHVEKM